MNQSLQIVMDKRSRKAVIIISVILLLTGIAGIALPQVMSFVVAVFIGWLLILAGAIVFYITWHGFRKRWIAWLKPFVLLTVGFLVLFYPVVGAAALGLLLAIYFMLDGFAGVVFARELRPHQGWGWLMFNGVLSFMLAAVFLIGWPFTSAWLVGLFIGISLVIDGITLLMLGLAAKNVS